MAEVGDLTEINKDESKKAQVTERLQKREEERVRHAEERKAAKAVKENTTVIEETENFFDEHFKQAQADIDKKLENMTTGSNESTVTSKSFDDLLLDVQKLQKFVTDSTRFLSAYKLQKAQTTINQLKTTIEEKRNTVQPKKKFAFKSDTKRAMQVAAETSTPAVPINTLSVAQKPTVPQTYSRQDSETGLSSRHNETLRMSSDDIDSKDVLLSTLSNCRVQLRGAPSTIHMNALHDCTVLCGPTAGSVFIDDCKGCTFVVACHQLRVHRTTDTDIYLHVTSRAIIEDCKVVRFAPFNWTYPGLDADFIKSALDQHRNHWNAVDDFNWLVANTPSPNWSVMDEDKRVSSWTENATSV